MNNNPVLTSKNNAPVPSSEPVVEAVIADADIVAKPLRAPNFINLRAKNPNMCLYWGNRSVGEKESGLRYDQLLSMGFAPAKPEQVVAANGMDCPTSLQRDGRIMYGDLICLIIPRAEYVGALKYNAESAARRVRRFGASQATGEGSGAATQGSDSALKEISNSKAAREGKIAAFIPSLAETDSRTADNSGIQANLAGK